MKSARTTILVILYLLAISTFGHANDIKNTAHRHPATIKFGTIPVLQSLPLFVAAENGFFKEQGLNVEIVLFNSAMEKDIALSSGQIAGYFGDMMTPMVLQANGVGVKITATNFNTSGKQRMFALLASPQAKNKTIKDVTKTGIATSSNAIPEYLIIKLLESQKISRENINFIDVKNIPIRMQMLLSNQVDAALLPEPLATLAEMKGAQALLDDKGQGISATVLVFSDRFLQQYPHSVKAFHKAAAKAADYINRNPQDVRAIMNRDCKMPETLRTSFTIPEFPSLKLPDREQILSVYKWLKDKKIITKNMTYKDIVADGYLP